MKTITRKVFSICSDFSEKMYEEFTADKSADCYVEYIANSREVLENKGYDNDLISNRLIELGASENEKVLIEMDW